MNFPLQAVAARDRRSCQRKVLRTVAQLRLPGAQALAVRTLDISSDGLCIAAAVNLPAKTECVVCLAMPVRTRGSTSVEIHACVVHSIFTSSEDCFKIGLQFTTLSPETAQTITQFLGA
jgi:c-di-GMP-binding flagellar brake protein YcgR